MPHTKTPWYAHCFYVTDSTYPGNLNGGIAHTGGVGRSSHESEANAEFICRACNAHEELLSVCTQFKHFLRWLEGRGLVNQKSLEGAISQVEAAIAKARGQEDRQP